ESFWITYSNPVNVTLGSDPRARIMIIDDDKGKPATRTTNDEITIEQPSLKIPTVTKRNQVWMIPQISNYENEVLITNVQGQIIARHLNYKNQIALGNIAAGLYFYRIRITDTSGQVKFYSGRLLVTE
ncbi:MAG TPA: T9SS type A sorting domain-containing protein, partial [Chitinophagaceae bacterium]|nr:T9SS type A sorting domain-containing protein [Chitinophagaceae bacterium]